MPAGEASERYYVADAVGARVNLDGAPTPPSWTGGYATPEPFTSTRTGTGGCDAGEAFTDRNGDGPWDAGNPVPYALADHAQPRHALARRAGPVRRPAWRPGSRTTDTPTWRLLLDGMIAEPAALPQRACS